MGLIDKFKVFVDEQKKKQFEAEKKELERLKDYNARAEEQYKVRVALAKERKKKKKFSKNPLRDDKPERSEPFYGNIGKGDSEDEFGTSDDFRSMVGGRYGKE